MIPPKLYTGLVALVFAVTLVPVQHGFAQQKGVGPGLENDPVAIFNAAIQAFNRGEWEAAAKGIEQALATVTDPLQKQKLAPVYYTLGAAYFNAGNYAKAVETFRKYLNDYPQHEKVAEARLALARSYFLAKNYAEAAQLFVTFENIPALREQSLAAQAECYRQLGKADDQIRVLEKLIAPEIKNGVQAGAALTLVELYDAKDQTDKVVALVNQLHARVAVVDNVVALNALTVKLGDDLAQKKDYNRALAAYRAVRTREQVITFQQARIAGMESRFAANAEAGRSNAQAFMAAATANDELKQQIESAKQLLAALEKLPDHMPAVTFRMARAWYDWGKKWETIVVFERLLREYPKAAEVEPALYSMIVSYADLNRIARTQELCDRYLATFPDGKNAGTVGYLKGASAMQAGDLKSAVSFFGTTLDKQPKSEFREQIRFLLGNAKFMQGDMAEARKEYLGYMSEFPKGQFAEEAQYRDALTYVFAGEFEPALEKLNGYLAQYANGSFAADAGYRLMVCKYAASEFEQVIADAARWQKKFPSDPIAGEVLSLLGDALAATDKTAEAAAAYQDAFRRATTDEVLDYALFEASKMLQKLNRWPEVSSMFEAFVNEKPEHPTVVAAMYWIGKAKAREGKTDEAKAFLVEQLKRFINEPKREAVEQLLQQLAQLCSKRPRQPSPPVDAPVAPVTPNVANAPAPVTAGSQVATPAPATPAPLPPYDAVAELKKQLAPLEGEANATGKARLLYAQAELAKLLKREPEVARIYAEIAKRFEPEALSPVLLAVVGDQLLVSGDTGKAAKLFDLLREDYPKSDYLDFAYAGLGEIALGKKDAAKALEYFSRAADDIAGTKIKDSTMGKARALLELERYDEAKKLFEQVASIREWRGESTAAALFYLGELEARRGRFAEAIAHFQRVFVAYQKFLPWAAKSYVRGAECFEKLGKRTEAIGHLQEMIRNEKLANFSETAQAKKMLTEWGVQG